MDRTSLVKKRIDYFDMAKGAGMLLVLIGHLQGDEIFKLSPYILPVCEWIFSFHMPLFFIVSGMLINYKGDADKDLKGLIKKRFKGIMIPYLWFSLFYFSIVIYAFMTGSVMKETLFVNLWYVVSMYGMNVLWFLPCIFMAEIMFLFILQRSGNKMAAVISVLITTTASLINLYISGLDMESYYASRLRELAITVLRPMHALIFVAIGYYVYFLFRENEKISVKELFIGVVLMAAGILFVHVNHGVDLRSLIQKNYFFYYLCALCGSLGLILICKNIRSFKIIKYWGRNSLIFMAVHNSKTVLYLGMMLAMYVNRFTVRAKGYISYADRKSVV
mgnify:CR=1 FL=1